MASIAGYAIKPAIKNEAINFLGDDFLRTGANTLSNFSSMKVVRTSILHLSYTRKV